MVNPSLSTLLADFPLELSPYESLYRHIHAHPELSLQEKATAELVRSHLSSLPSSPFEIHSNIGGCGLAGVFRNQVDKGRSAERGGEDKEEEENVDEGMTVLLRADMDALPVEEKTGLEYASEVVMRDVADGMSKKVMHACGHDMHITCLLAAAERLVQMRERWRGTLVVVFQPNEERGGGAQGMVDDGLYDKVPVPDVVLGQHVVPRRTGTLSSRVGLVMAGSDSHRIRLYGRGGHGSMPHKTIDPVVMAASVVVRLQTIVSREVDPSDMAVVTVGSLQAGQVENIIADFADIKVNVRSLNSETREKVLAAIRRIVKAESDASGAPREPEITQICRFPVSINDEKATQRLAASFGEYFGPDVFDPAAPRMNFSEDYSILGTCRDRPCSFWFFGGTDAQVLDEATRRGTVDQDVPVNHSPFFAPVIQPTMQRGVDAMTLAALTFFALKI